MSFKTLLALTAFLAAIQLGIALKCYACGGSETSDCAKGKISAMSVANCKAPADPTQRSYSYFNTAHSGDSDDDSFKPVCLQILESGYQPKLFVRGCGLFPSSADPCEYLEAHANVDSCKSCKTDLCNQRAKTAN